MATALELRREGWKPYIDAARRRQTPHRIEEESSVRDELLGRTREVATVLKGRFGARRVVLFGSLADKQWFGPHCDVDLATEGVTSSQYWDAWRVAGEMIGDRVVDLVEIETAKQSLRRAIEQHGIDL